MDWKQFFASIVGSIAWPVAIVAILFVFRVQVRQLISQIKKIGAGGVNLELAEQVENVRTAGQAVEQEENVSSPDFPLDSAILELARNFPEAAFLQAFKQLEGVILQFRDRLPEGKPHRGLYEVLRQLRNKEYISSSVVELFLQLRKTRNAAAHGGEEELTSGEALELIRQVRLLEDLLKNVLDQIPKPSGRI